MTETEEIMQRYAEVLRAVEEERRFRAACAAMQGMLANNRNAQYQTLAKESVCFADALLARLKETEDE